MKLIEETKTHLTIQFTKKELHALTTALADFEYQLQQFNYGESERNSTWNKELRNITNLNKLLRGKL